MTRRKTPRERYLLQFGLDLSLYSAVGLSRCWLCVRGWQARSVLGLGASDDTQA